MPVLAKISFGGKNVKAYVNAGPSLGFCLNGKVKLESDSGKSETDIKFGQHFNFDKEFGVDNRFEVGAQFGGGIGLNAWARRFIIRCAIWPWFFQYIQKRRLHVLKKKLPPSIEYSPLRLAMQFR